MGHGTRYIIDLQESLRIILRQPPDREMLHQFRVQVKKMKALWIIHPIGNNIAFSTSFSTLNKLYHLAAQTRDLQMILQCLETIPDFEKYPSLKKLLKSGIKRKRKKFAEKLALRRTRLRIYEENRLFREYFRVASGFLIRQNRKAFKIAVFEKLNSLSGNEPTRIHRLRRSFKQLIFQYDAFHFSNTFQEHRFSREFFDRTQHEIGNWHDWWNTLEWLKKQDETFPISLLLNPIITQVAKKEELLRLGILKEIYLLNQHINLSAVHQ
jgi:CHAD domain-containing protein